MKPYDHRYRIVPGQLSLRQSPGAVVNIFAWTVRLLVLLLVRALVAVLVRTKRSIKLSPNRLSPRTKATSVICAGDKGCSVLSDDLSSLYIQRHLIVTNPQTLLETSNKDRNLRTKPALFDRPTMNHQCRSLCQMRFRLIEQRLLHIAIVTQI